MVEQAVREGLSGGQDFVGRYEEGAPWAGISPDEAYHHYRTVAGRLSAQEYEEAATEAFARLTPQDRAQLADTMRRHGNVRIDWPEDDAHRLARAMSRFRQQNSSGFDLGDLFGAGGRDDLMSNPLAKAALGGIAAMAMKRAGGE